MKPVMSTKGYKERLNLHNSQNKHFLTNNILFFSIGSGEHRVFILSSLILVELPEVANAP